MIALNGYILFESVIVWVGLALGLDFLLVPKFEKGNPVVTPVELGGVVLGLLVGGLCIWLLNPTFRRQTDRSALTSVPLWLASILLGYFVGGLTLWYLADPSKKRPDDWSLDWRIILMAGMLSTIFGLLIGGTLTWRFNKLLARVPLSEVMPDLIGGMGAYEPPKGRQATRAERSLSNDMVTAAQRQSAKCFMQKLGESYVLQFNWQTAASNQVTCYVICENDYPTSLPSDVKIEVVYPDKRSEDKPFNLDNLSRMPKPEVFFWILSDVKQMVG